jgi:hypothetical protein
VAFVYSISTSGVVHSQNTREYLTYRQVLVGLEEMSEEDKPLYACSLVERVKALPEGNTPIRKFEALLRMLKLVDDLTIENFDFSDPPAMHVAPPRGSGVDSGSSSSAIKDPKLRKEYEINLERNRLKAKVHGGQHSLRIGRRSVLSSIGVFVSNHRDSSESLETVIKVSPLEMKSKNDVLELLVKAKRGKI